MNDAGRFAALTLEAVERRYGRGDTTVEVLNGASLALYPGQSVALIAPSGAGKSTLLHLAGLLERPSGGEVSVAGSPTSTMTDDQRTALRRGQIGFVYQFHHLLPEFSALENLVLPQMIAGLLARRGGRPRPRAARLSRARQARDPSAGRAVGRRAAARRHRPRRRQRPRILLADEPTGNLDPKTADHVFATLAYAGEGDRPRRPDRHPQHGPRRPHGPAGDDPGGAGGGGGVGERVALASVRSFIVPIRRRRRTRAR